MKINYKYSRNNAQFLYDLSCTSNIDQLIRRLTGRQIITNKNGEKEHVDPAFNVDEILIDDVEVFNRLEHETVYNNVDKLRAPWDDTENKELSAEDARRRNDDLAKAASLLKIYNDRFVELEKRLSLLPADVRKIPNEFMSIGVNGFYRTISISLGLNEYLDEISTDKKAFKIFNTAEEQNKALANVMSVIDFLSKLDESAQELFNSDDQQDAPNGDQDEPNGDQEEVQNQQDVPNGDQEEVQNQQDVPNGDQEEVQNQQDVPNGDQEEVQNQQDVPNGDQEEVQNQQDVPNGDQQDADVSTDGTENSLTDDRQEAPTNNVADDQQDADEGQRDASTDGIEKAPAPNVNQQAADKSELTGAAAIDAQLFSNITEFLKETD